jgi:hypothetical protein
LPWTLSRPLAGPAAGTARSPGLGGRNIDDRLDLLVREFGEAGRAALRRRMSWQDNAGCAKEDGERQYQQTSRDHRMARAVLERDH